MNLKTLSLSTWIVGLVFGLTCHAEFISTCEVSGTLQLEQDTQILCQGDLQFAEGTVIITNGFALAIISSGGLDLSSKLSIRAFEENAVVAMDAGPIAISATTASGHLLIDNMGSSAESQSGTIDIEYVSTFNYGQDISVDAMTPVNIILNGFYVTAANF